MLEKIAEDLENQTEKCILNFDSIVSYWRCLNVGTV